MVGELAVVCLLTDRDEAPILRELTKPSAGVALRRRCLDASELLGLAQAGIGDIAVVTPDAPGLEPAVLAAVREAGLAIVLVGDESDPAVAALAHEVVPDLVVTPERVAELAAALHDLRTIPQPVAPAGAEPPSDPDQAGTGRLIAVWGPRGAPGRTTLAVNLAAELAHRELSVLLVDADLAGGCIALMLGLLDESPGILAAARLSDGDMTERRLAHLTPLAAGMRVLTGIDGAARAAELRAAPLDAVWRVARQLADVTVIDAGGPPLAESLVAPADDLLIVGRGDPLGVNELVAALIALPERSDQRRMVAVNRVRTSAVGGRPGPSLRHALRRFAGVTITSLLPDDIAAVDGAVLHGRTLREAAPDAALTRAIELLADEIMAGGSHG